jgi:hypothetical protein
VSIWENVIRGPNFFASGRIFRLIWQKICQIRQHCTWGMLTIRIVVQCNIWLPHLKYISNNLKHIITGICLMRRNICFIIIVFLHTFACLMSWYLTLYGYLNFMTCRVDILILLCAYDRIWPEISYNIDCGLDSLCYIRPCSIWIAWQHSSPMKGELRGGGQIVFFFKFDRYNISGGTVDDTWRHR